MRRVPAWPRRLVQMHGSESRPAAFDLHPAMCSVMRYNRSVGVEAASFHPSLGRCSGHMARERRKLTR